jgi:hypothetical protein
MIIDTNIRIMFRFFDEINSLHGIVFLTLLDVYNITLVMEIHFLIYLEIKLMSSYIPGIIISNKIF